MAIDDVSVKRLHLFRLELTRLAVTRVMGGSLDLQESDIERLQVEKSEFGELIVSGGRVHLEAAGTENSQITRQ